MKTHSNISILKEYTVVLIFFILGGNLFVYFKTAGLYEIFSNPALRPFDPLTAHLKATIGGLFLGFNIITFESRIYPWLSRYYIKWLRRIIWFICVFALIFITVFLIHFLHLLIFEDYAFAKAMNLAIQMMLTGIFISFFVFGFLLSLTMSFIRQMRINFGETVFLNYLYGKYSNPLIEHRSFMFLDLNNSTGITEQLGNTKYSRFLNKCFDDILEALAPFSFEVYQFVGDEVVLTWKIQDDPEGKAFAMFQEVSKKLLEEQRVYERLFGVVPAFKAGVSSGEVTGRFVGTSNRQMAYHGDVLNTTARILGQCKKLKRNFLFTDFYLKNIKEPLKFQPKFLSELKLRGKQQTTKIYCAEKMHK